MKTHPLAFVLGAVFGAVGFLLGIKLTTSQDQNRDTGPGDSASSVPVSGADNGNSADSVTEEPKP